MPLLVVCMVQWLVVVVVVVALLILLLLSLGLFFFYSFLLSSVSAFHLFFLYIISLFL